LESVFIIAGKNLPRIILLAAVASGPLPLVLVPLATGPEWAIALMLGAATIVSVHKPWGKTWFGRQKALSASNGRLPRDEKDQPAELARAIRTFVRDMP
jgi:hypothetical protein